jgi:hypothetical protein
MHVYFSLQRLDRWKLNYKIWLASEWFWKWQTIKKLGEVLEKACLVAEPKRRLIGQKEQSANQESCPIAGSTHLDQLIVTTAFGGQMH